MSETTPHTPSEFEKAASSAEAENLASEFWAFLSQNKKWWLLPILIVMLILGGLILLSMTAAAPFIYTLF
jgi:hypothetical protein